MSMKKPLCGLIVLLGWVCVSQPGFCQSTEATPAPQAQSAEPSSPGGKRVREFQGDDVGQVLRLLARQAKVSLMVDETIKGTVNMRLENSTALEAIEAIARSCKYSLTQDDKGIYYVSPPDTIQAALELIARPETANRIAAYKRHLFVALMGQGFSADESLKIVLASDLGGVVPAIAGKADTPAPK